MTFRTFALAAVGAALVASPALAASTDGTFAASIVGVGSSTPTIGSGTVFTNTLFTVVGSATGDLAGSAGTFLTISSLTATNGSSFSFTSGIGNFSGTLSNVLALGPVENRTLSAYALGTFTPLGAYSAFDAGPASLTFSFTQTGGPDSAVSGSFSFSSPPAPAPSVPEPAAWAMLIAGFGLTGAAMRRRRIAVAA